MSSIGMMTSLAEHDEFCLVVIDGSLNAQMLDCDGDTVMHLTIKQAQEAAECFPLIVWVYQQGLTSGERTGRFRQQHDIQKALGMGQADYRINRLERSVFPGEA